MPTLFVVATPIGNLGDITVRALDTLRSVSVILAEDTRRTRILLRAYDIRTPLLSYHQHNKRGRIPEVLEMLGHQDVGLVSSAGMPSVSDPGFELIDAALDAGVQVDVLPGPSAAITAVVAAAIPAPGFVVMGFLPRRSSERRKRLEDVAGLHYSLVLFEAPHRLVATLRDIEATLGNRYMAAVREMTKVHAETIRGSVSAVLDTFQEKEPRGEFTLVVEGVEDAPEGGWEDRALAELRELHAQGGDAREAVSRLRRIHGLNRNEAYRLWLQVTAGADDGTRS